MASFRLITTTFLLSIALCAAQSSAPPVPMNAAAEAHLQANIPALMEKAGRARAFDCSDPRRQDSLVGELRRPK